MHIVSPIPAAVAGLVLFFLPGLALWAWLDRDEARDLGWDEALFLVVATSVVASIWVGLLLAELGRFSLIGAATLLLLLSLAAGLLRGRARWNAPAPLRWRQLAPTTAVLALALVLQARPSEYLVGGRDPGTYVAAMALIARHGSIAYTDPMVLSVPREDLDLFYREPANPDFSWSRFMGFPLERPQTGRVFPEFFHAFPVFGAYLFQAMGIKGALATPVLFGLLGTLAVFFALRRILGPAPAFLASLLLSVNVIQVWFARYPVSEPLSQFLLFFGLWAVARWEERDSSVFAAVAGVAFGISLLARFDSLLVLAPLALYFGVRRLRGDSLWPGALALLAPLALLVGHTAIHALIWSRKYAESVLSRPYWRHSAPVWLAVLTLLVLGSLWLYKLAPRLSAWLAPRARSLPAITTAVVGLACFYAYGPRPLMSRWAGADKNAGLPTVAVRRDGACLRDGTSHHPCLARDESVRVLARRGKDFLVLSPAGAGKRWGYLRQEDLSGTPPASLPPWWVVRALLAGGFEHLAAQDAQALVRFGWFVTPLGLLLAFLGLAGLLRTAQPRAMLLVSMTLSFGAFYFYKLRVYDDYYFAARRFVPLLLPSCLGLAAFYLTRLARRSGWYRWASGLLALTLLSLFIARSRPIWRYVDWSGTVDFVGGLAHHFGPEDAVIFEQRENLHLLSLPLWAVHGVNVLELARWDPDPERLRHLVVQWRQRYRNIYFVYSYRARKGLCGLFLQTMKDEFFPTWEWERGYTGPPRQAEPRSFRFTIARVLLPEEVSVPPLAELDVGGSDDYQVSGFYDKEGASPETFRWTGPCASIYLPAARAGDRLVIRLSSGQRPLSTPVATRLSLSGVWLGSCAVRSFWTDCGFDLPARLPPGPPLLRLETSTWRPANSLPGSEDVRDLGVMVERVSITRPDAGSATIAPSIGAGGKP